VPRLTPCSTIPAFFNRACRARKKLTEEVKEKKRKKRRKKKEGLSCAAPGGASQTLQTRPDHPLQHPIMFAAMSKPLILAL
jgi:hypothetical protein